MTPTEAVKIIAEQYQSPMSRMALEAWIRSGTCPFGVHIKKTGTGPRGKHQIFPTRMHAFYQAKDLTYGDLSATV